MPAFDSNLFILATSIQQSFLDKNSGLLLEGGYLYFYKDDASRNTMKPVYYQVGDFGSYEMIAFPNPMILSAIGTVVDPGGNPKQIYYNPFDGENNPENYFIEVYSSGGKLTGTFQFSIANFPGVGSGGGDSTEADLNYIGNGQFRLHNDVLATETQLAGFVTEDDIIIAPGGHHFIHDNTTGQRYVTFVQNPSSTGNAFPRYEARFTQTGTGIDGSYNNYAFRVKNANTFADGMPYTLLFTARTDSGSILVKGYYYQYFGTGQVSDSRQYFDEVTVGSAQTGFGISHNFNSTAGKTAADDNSDYFEIGLAFPANTAYDIYITDLVLTKGDQTSATYPMTTSQEDAWRALAGGFKYEGYDVDETSDTFGEITTGTYDGSLIGLPVFIGKDGLEPDLTQIGSVTTISYEITDFSNIPYLPGDGLAKYESASQSAMGIPYARLWRKYWNDTLKLPKYGTGLDYFTTISLTSDQNLCFFNNKFGAANPVQAFGTGFGVPQEIHISNTTGYFLRTYQTDSGQFSIQSLLSSPSFGDPANGTTSAGFTFNIIYSTDNASTNGRITGASRMYATVTTTNAAALANPAATAKHWIFDIYNGTTILQFYVWYVVSGTEIDPAVPGASPIKVVLNSGDTADIVAKKTIFSLIGGEVTSVPCPTAAAITGTPYLNLQGSGNVNYFIWLNKDGGGVKPGVAGIGIEVTVTTGQTNVEVANAILLAANKKFFSLPDYRGIFLRGWDNGRGLDYDAISRYTTYVPGISGDHVGTQEIDSNLAHNHYFTLPTETAGPANKLDAAGDTTNEFTSISGLDESRPYNISVQYVIRY